MNLKYLDPQSKSSRAGVQFPVEIIHRFLRERVNAKI